MRVSEWLRKYQITGQVPEEADPPQIAFWAGWLMGTSNHGEIKISPTERMEMSIKAAEFIEACARS